MQNNETFRQIELNGKKTNYYVSNKGRVLSFKTGKDVPIKSWNGVMPLYKIYSRGYKIYSLDELVAIAFKDDIARDNKDIIQDIKNLRAKIESEEIYG